MWLVAGFCITILYKSTLSAELASIDYLTPIDTVVDALHSGKTLYCYGGSNYDERMQNDPRASVRELAEKHLQTYNFTSTGTPNYVQDE